MNPPIETSEDAGRYLETLINLEQRPELMHARMSLAPIRTLLDRLGKPDQGLAVIHVAGSKGKGSTCLFAEAGLAEAGRRTGVFTSPHLHRWTERFRVAGREVEGAQLASAVSQLRPHVDWLREHEPENAPTFFDATTAAALLLFAEAGLDYVVLEVGLGGRLDSTNAVLPRVTCVTSIELEHTDKLGNTLAEIAAEKAGIIKPGVPCVIGRLHPEAEAVIRARASERGAPVFQLGHDFAPFDAHEVAVLGRHQLDNAAIAFEAIEQLQDPGGTGFKAAVRAGIRAARLPARIEVLCDDPWVIVDGAHTERSARALAEVLSPRARNRATLLLSVSRDKNLAAIFDPLLPLFDTVVATQADPHRSLAADELAARVQAARPEIAVEPVPDAREAADRARARTQAGDMLVAAGSIYLAAAARERWSDWEACDSPDPSRNSR